VTSLWRHMHVTCSMCQHTGTTAWMRSTCVFECVIHYTHGKPLAALKAGRGAHREPLGSSGWPGISPPGMYKIDDVNEQTLAFWMQQLPQVLYYRPRRPHEPEGEISGKGGISTWHGIPLGRCPSPQWVHTCHVPWRSSAGSSPWGSAHQGLHHTCVTQFDTHVTHIDTNVTHMSTHRTQHHCLITERGIRQSSHWVLAS
jgi:hypothetical protein